MLRRVVQDGAVVVVFLEECRRRLPCWVVAGSKGLVVVVTLVVSSEEMIEAAFLPLDGGTSSPVVVVVVFFGVVAFPRRGRGCRGRTRLMNDDLVPAASLLLRSGARIDEGGQGHRDAADLRIEEAVEGMLPEDLEADLAAGAVPGQEGVPFVVDGLEHGVHEGPVDEGLEAVGLAEATALPGLDDGVARPGVGVPAGAAQGRHRSHEPRDDARRVHAPPPRFHGHAQGAVPPRLERSTAGSREPQHVLHGRRCDATRQSGLVVRLFCLLGASG
mmetsp:Transcript_21176/g.68306  ORF Transcript_21176/g.68306 Transcript_21176/m.68306 type:complete len:274 (-) Transcript_21176:215-1036(-)